MDPSAHRTDMALAERAAAGDEHAWREIYLATREKLFALLVYQLGTREEALDVLQETYLQAVRGMRAYEGRGSLESWLCGIAVRRALDWKRRFLGRHKRTEPLSEEHEEIAGESLQDPEQGRRLRTALARLPERQRGAVLLHEWFGYSFREVGELLGCGEATARVHAFRGRDTLRELMGEETIAGSDGAPLMDVSVDLERAPARPARARGERP